MSNTEATSEATSEATTSTAVRLETPQDYIDYGMRLVTTQTEAWWQHPKQHWLRNYIDLGDALAIIERFEDDYKVIRESGPAGGKVILTPVPVKPEVEAPGRHVITKRWMTVHDLEEVLGVCANTIRAWARDSTAEQRQVVGVQGGLKAIRMWPDTVQALGHRFGVDLTEDIREEGHEVRPYEVALPPSGAPSHELAEKVGLGPSHFRRKLRAAGISVNGAVRPTPELRDWLRETYDIELRIEASGEAAGSASSKKDHAPAR